MSNNVKKPSAVKEFFRKQIVTLKRNPQNIPMAMLLISFIYYSLNLTNMSNTTAKIQGVGMGLCQFCIMLFSLLSIVCMLNAFPSRKKPVYPMVALMFVMFGIMIYADIHFCNGIMAALTRAESPISTADNPYILQAFNMLNVHRIILVVGSVLTLLVPVLRKLLKKIDTSLPMEEGSQMESLHLSQED